MSDGRVKVRLSKGEKLLLETAFKVGWHKYPAQRNERIAEIAKILKMEPWEVDTELRRVSSKIFRAYIQTMLIGSKMKGARA